MLINGRWKYSFCDRRNVPLSHLSGASRHCDSLRPQSASDLGQLAPWWVALLRGSQRPATDISVHLEHLHFRLNPIRIVSHLLYIDNTFNRDQAWSIDFVLWVREWIMLTYSWFLRIKFILLITEFRFWQAGVEEVIIRQGKGLLRSQHATRFVNKAKWDPVASGHYRIDASPW